MNWVGGTRNRLTMKDNVKRQREFFEKKKLQQRLKNLGLSLPNSSEVSTSGSMDLVNLFIVNQIASKKENKDPPKVAVLSDGGRLASKRRRNEPLVLPMSPCSPSQLSLVEGQPESSRTRKRKYVSTLSPVLESASDNSASDYAPHAADAHSPFSTSSASSGQSGGIFSEQLNQQQRRRIEPEPAEFWSRLEHPLPREPMNPLPWSCPLNLTKLETPSPAQVLFGSPSPFETDLRVYVNPVVSDDLSQTDMVSQLDFSLNQYEEFFAEEVNGEMCRNGNFSFYNEDCVKSKIHLKGDTSVQPQMGPVTQYCGNELFSRANTRFSCPGNISAMMDDGKNSPRCFSSDSSDNEEECWAEPCVKAASFSMNHACAESNQQVFPQFITHGPKIREETVTWLTKSDHNHQTGSISAALSHQPLSQEECKCITKRTETHEIGTQTDNPCTSEKRDTAIQCSLYWPFIGASVQHLSTRGQTVHTRKKEEHVASLLTVQEKIQEDIWSRMMQSGNTCGNVNPQPLKPC